MYITLAQAKQHLNIETGYTADDSYINSLIDVAEASVAVHVNEDLDELADEGGNIPAPLTQAMLLMIGNLYQNREVVGSKTVALPFSYEYLIRLYQNYNN